MKKPVNSSGKGKYPRKTSILDAFEAVANESHEEMLDLSKNPGKRTSLDVSSPRKNRLEMGPVNVAPFGRGGGSELNGKVSARKSAPLEKNTFKSHLALPKKSFDAGNKRSASVLNGGQVRNFGVNRKSADHSSQLKPMATPSNFR